MLHQNAVRVTLLFVNLGIQLQRWVPANWNLGIDSRVEGLDSRAFSASLLAELIWSIAKHNALIVTNRSFRKISAVATGATPRTAAAPSIFLVWPRVGAVAID